MTDMISHPSHYRSHESGVECIDLARWLNFCLGSSWKYLWRAGLKGSALEDLGKARQFIEFELGTPTQPLCGHEVIPPEVWAAYDQWSAGSPDSNLTVAMRLIWNSMFSETPVVELQSALLFIDEEIALLPTLEEVRAARVSLEDVVSRREFELVEQERDMALLELDRDGAA